MNYNPRPFYERVFDTPLGRNLWDFLNQPPTIAGMQDKSDLRRPAVEFLEEKLPRRLRREVAGDSEVNFIKQMIGNMVRQVLEGKGYRHRPVRRKVKPEGGLFDSGSLYEQIKM